MTNSIYNYMKKLDKEEQITFLRNCFYMDIRFRKEKRFPRAFMFEVNNFSQREILYASKLYLDTLANYSEKNTYYKLLEEYIENISPNNELLYQKYKEVFYIYINDNCYTNSFIGLMEKYGCTFDELLEYPSRYAAIFANESERNKFKLVACDNRVEVIRMKYYYDFCYFNKWNYDKIYNFSLQIGKNIMNILEICKYYAKRYLQLTDLTNIEKLIEEERCSLEFSNIPVKNIFINLEKLITSESVIKYLSNIQIEIDIIKEYLDNYIKIFKSSLTDNEKQQLKKSIEDKFEIYTTWKHLQEFEKKRKIEKKNEKKLTPKDFLLLYLNGVDSKDNFCKKKEISSLKFDNMLNSLKETDITLYEKIKEKLLLEQKELEKTINIIRKIIYQIKHGIEEENYREFDLLDYYMNTKLSFKEVKTICKNYLTKEEYAIFISFTVKNRSISLTTKVTEEYLLKQEFGFRIKIDDGSSYMHFATNDEKLEVINKLKEMEVPLYYSLFQIALQRKFTLPSEFKRLKR